MSHFSEKCQTGGQTDRQKTVFRTLRGTGSNEMKNRKASGPSGVVLKMFNVSGKPCYNSLTVIFNILLEHKLLEELMLSSLVPIFKRKGDPPPPPSLNSYKGIQLLEHAFKLSEKVHRDSCISWWISTRCNIYLCQGKGLSMLCLFWEDFLLQKLQL